MHRNTWLPILVVLLIGLGVRLAMLNVFPEIPVRNDQAAYEKNALKLLDQGILDWKFSLRAPGYIFFLSANFLASGASDKLFVRVMQSLLSTATIAVIYGIARLTFNSIPPPRSRTVALLAAILFALYPDIVFFSQTLWSETFFILLTALGIYLILWSYREGRFPIGFVLSGLTMGFAILTREALLLFGAGFVPIWLWWVSAGEPWERFKRSLIYLAAVLLVVLPWTARNYFQGRGLELISSQGGRDLLIYNLVALEPARSEGAIRVLRREHGTTEEFDAALGREILEGILANPVSWALAKTVEVRGVWDDPQSNLNQFGPQLKILSTEDAARIEPFLIMLWWVVLGLALVGFVCPQDGKTRILFLCYFLTWILIFYVFQFIPRFRLALIPFLVPFTAFGLIQLGASIYTVVRPQKSVTRLGA